MRKLRGAVGQREAVAPVMHNGEVCPASLVEDPVGQLVETVEPERDGDVHRYRPLFWRSNAPSAIDPSKVAPQMKSTRKLLNRMS